MSQVKTEQRRAEFLLPELPDRVAIGRMCCVVPCEDLIEQELGSWPGVEAVKVNQPEGRVEVVLSQEHPSLDQLVWSLKIVGFDDVQVLAFPNASPD